MNRLAPIAILSVALTMATSRCVVSGEPPSAADLAFFETKIRPVLAQHCYECHSAEATELGGKLRLDNRDAMLQGGESGPALVSGDPGSSPIIQALRYEGVEMPPDQPLPPSVVNNFVKWIERGAADPRTAESTQPYPAADDSQTFWSFQPPHVSPLPDVQDLAWPRVPLDHFVLSGIEAAGAMPAPDASAGELIRRLYYDLTGLPPSPQQIQRFEADHQRDGAAAVQRLVDALLASPQFGERWGRHWLDVARYGESNGNDGLGRNPTFPHAWRYRDYVVAAFNQDVPYDQFLLEQIAGDLLPADSPQMRDRYLIATGFLALGSKPAKAMNTNFDMDVVADQIDVIGLGIMGLSVGCARCHDHKFDPIPTRDYYALAGIFTSTETLWGLAANETLTAPATDLHLLTATPGNPPGEGFVETVLTLESNTGKPKAAAQSKWPPGTALAMGVRDRKKPADSNIHINGESDKTGAAVPRGFIEACQPTASDLVAMDARQSGRLQLAQWLTRSDHPLTSRVMVNRIWLHLFGQGIVRTPDEFGLYGQRPTHPQLLDYLAVQFQQNGWSIKQMIRSLVLSRTYQLSSHTDAASLRADPQNLLLARHQRRRLDAESLRDSMLKVSGQLDLRPARGSIIQHRDILLNQAGNLHQPSHQRSVYLCYLRGAPPPELAAFDLPDFTTVMGQRDVSTVPGQALHLYNSPFVVQQANGFAQLVIHHAQTDEARARFAWRRALGRQPSDDELQQALRLVRSTASTLGSKSQAWASLCQALLATNEFRYVD